MVIGMERVSFQSKLAMYEVILKFKYTSSKNVIIQCVNQKMSLHQNVNHKKFTLPYFIYLVPIEED